MHGIVYESIDSMQLADQASKGNGKAQAKEPNCCHAGDAQGISTNDAIVNPSRNDSGGHQHTTKADNPKKLV